jgi:hypothetical protein
LGFVACHTTSKTLGVGPCEQNWAAVKNIQTGKRVNLGGESVEKRAVLYASALINDARVKRKENENLEASATSWKTMDPELLGVPLGFLGIREILKLVHFSNSGLLGFAQS